MFTTKASSFDQKIFWLEECQTHRRKTRLSVLEDEGGRIQGDNERYYTTETVQVKPYLYIAPSFTKWDDVQNTKYGMKNFGEQTQRGEVRQVPVCLSGTWSLSSTAIKGKIKYDWRLYELTPWGCDSQSRSTAGFDPNLMSAFSSRSCKRNICDADGNRQRFAKRIAMSGCRGEVSSFAGELSRQAQTCSLPQNWKKDRWCSVES